MAKKIEIVKDENILSHMGVDAMKWAEQFCARFGTDVTDEGLMLGWFANAIESGRNAGQKDNP